MANPRSAPVAGTLPPSRPGTVAPAGTLLHSLDKVAELTTLSHRTIWSLCKSGELPSIKVGSRRLVTAAGLNAWLEAKLGQKGGTHGQ